MPLYVFECVTEGCAVKFERNLKIGDHPTHECPRCHELAPRIIEGFAFGFNQEATGNTGVHKEDYPTADHAVGRDAETRWESHQLREDVKGQARKKGGTHALIRHNPKDGSHIDYEPMSDGGRIARRSLAKFAVEKLSEEKPSR